MSKNINVSQAYQKNQWYLEGGTDHQSGFHSILPDAFLGTTQTGNVNGLIIL